MFYECIILDGSRETQKSRRASDSRNDRDNRVARSKNIRETN